MPCAASVTVDLRPRSERPRIRAGQKVQRARQNKEKEGRIDEMIAVCGSLARIMERNMP